MKHESLQLLALALHNELAALESAQEAAVKEATHEESRAENQYDTRSTEASYLAAGQAQRILSLKKDIYVLQNFKPKDFNPSDQIQIGALVELKSEEETSFYLLSPAGGGVKVSCQGKIVQFLNQESALGRELLDKRMGDDVEIKTRIHKLFTIISVL